MYDRLKAKEYRARRKAQAAATVQASHADEGENEGNGARVTDQSPLPLLDKGAFIYHMNVVCAVLQTAFCAYRHKRKRRELSAQRSTAIALYHCSIKIISRGKGKSAVAAAAYRSDTKITNQREREKHDYTCKGGVIHTEILLPDHAPTEYTDRSILWNAVEKIEKAKTSQLARKIEISSPVELTREQNLSLAMEYVKRHFVAEGMCADLCLHDTGGDNLYAHVMLNMRHFEQGGKWGKKQKKEYILDEKGNKIYDPIKRQYECNSIPLTDWNEHSKAEQWRSAWADCVYATLEQYGHSERVDHRSYERQGIEQIPTVHLVAVASQMEKRGIATERGNLNREIEISNQHLRQLKARIGKLQNWLKEEQQSTAPTTLADYIQDTLKRKAQLGKSSVSQSIYNLKVASNMLNFLTANNIMDMAGLDEKFSSMLDEQRIFEIS